VYWYGRRPLSAAHACCLFNQVPSCPKLVSFAVSGQMFVTCMCCPRPSSCPVLVCCQPPATLCLVVYFTATSNHSVMVLSERVQCFQTCTHPILPSQASKFRILFANRRDEMCLTNVLGRCTCCTHRRFDALLVHAGLLKPSGKEEGFTEVTDDPLHVSLIQNVIGVGDTVSVSAFPLSRFLVCLLARLLTFSLSRCSVE
jgi:hypothetical protein